MGSVILNHSSEDLEADPLARNWPKRSLERYAERNVIVRV